MIKICFWLNIPSIHQTPFLHELRKRPDVDVMVCYFDFNTELVAERRQQGWTLESLAPGEKSVTRAEELYRVDSWRERIHILGGGGSPFVRELLKLLTEHRLNWYHWSERSGISFARLIHYNVFVYRHVYPLLSRVIHRKYAGIINRYARGALAIGELARRDFVDWGVRPDQIDELYYSCGTVSPQDDVMRQKTESTVLRFIYVGALYHRKGIDLLLKAFSCLKERERCRLTLVGQDLSGGRYEKMAQTLGISNQVEWAGAVVSTEVSSWIARADVLILPSRYDGWGAVLNEGAMAGKALIASDQCGAAWHLICNDVNGWRIPAGKIKALHEAMENYQNDEKLAQRHGAESLRIYQSFSPEANAARLIEILQRQQNISQQI